jgi:hypothetical protein
MKQQQGINISLMRSPAWWLHDEWMPGPALSADSNSPANKENRQQ